MPRRTNLLLALALSLSAAAACDEAIDGDFGAGDDIALRPGFGAGGLYLNTNALGDHPLHEMHRLGAIHENVELVAVYIKVTGKEDRGSKGLGQELKLDEVWAEKGEIFGSVGGTKYNGKDFVGSRWEVNTYGGGIKNREMFIESYRFDFAEGLHKYTLGYPNDPAYGMHFYTLKKKFIGESGLLAACADDTEGLEAVIYENTHVDMKSGDVAFKMDLINFACLSGGVGKAARFGYPAYAYSAEEFQTAVRMIRADYLGDGDSYTKPGTAIDLEDNLGINSFVDPSFETEVIWTPTGAACIGVPRRPEYTTADIVAEGVPLCKDTKLGDVAGAYMWTKTPI